MDVQADIGHVIKMLAGDKPDLEPLLSRAREYPKKLLSTDRSFVVAQLSMSQALTSEP